MPAESVIERLRRLEAEESIWPVRVPRGDLRLLLAVVEAGIGIQETHRVIHAPKPCLCDFCAAMSALRAGGERE